MSLPLSTAAIRAAAALAALVVGKRDEDRAGDAMPGRPRHLGLELGFQLVDDVEPSSPFLAQGGSLFEPRNSRRTPR